MALGTHRLHLNRQGVLELPGTSISRAFNRASVDVKRTVGAVRMKLKRIGDSECVFNCYVTVRGARVQPFAPQELLAHTSPQQTALTVCCCGLNCTQGSPWETSARPVSAEQK